MSVPSRSVALFGLCLVWCLAAAGGRCMSADEDPEAPQPFATTSPYYNTHRKTLTRLQVVPKGASAAQLGPVDSWTDSVQKVFTR